MKVNFLYGSQSGTAEVLAMDMQEKSSHKHYAQFTNLEDADINIFDSDDDLYVFVLATYGEGEYTNSAEEFFDELESSRPDLSNVKYSIFGLGDKDYEESYNMASKNANKLLSDLGATLFGEIGEFDAGTGQLAEGEGIPWVEKLLSTL